MKCVVCDINMEALLSIQDDGEKRLVFCPNHEVAFNLGIINESDFQSLPSEIKPEGNCDLCSNEKIYYKNGEEFDVCKDHVNKLIKLNLSPSEYFTLVEKHGDATYILHDDFYDPETGIAMQPRDEE